MDWTISDGSGGESYTVGRAESESEAQIVGKPSKNITETKILDFENYAQMLLVNFLVVVLFSFLVITRNPPERF